MMLWARYWIRSMVLKTSILIILDQLNNAHHKHLWALSSVIILTAKFPSHQVLQVIKLWITKYKSHIVETCILNRRKLSNRIKEQFQSTEQKAILIIIMLKDFKIKCNRKDVEIHKIRIIRMDPNHSIHQTLIQEMKVPQKWI